MVASVLVKEHNKWLALLKLERATRRNNVFRLFEDCQTLALIPLAPTTIAHNWKLMSSKINAIAVGDFGKQASVADPGFCDLAKILPGSVSVQVAKPKMTFMRAKYVARMKREHAELMAKRNSDLALIGETDPALEKH